jgi:hypothetical protein
LKTGVAPAMANPKPTNADKDKARGG